MRKYLFLALALLAVFLSGCTGFGAGVKEAVTGLPSPDGAGGPGFMWGQMVGNVLVAALGYLSGRTHAAAKKNGNGTARRELPQ